MSQSISTSTVTTGAITPAQYGAPTDGVSSSDAAIVAAANAAVAQGKPLLIDQTYAFMSKWTPPAGLQLTGNGVDVSTLLWKGTGDAIEIINPISIDGLTVDGGVPAGQDRTTSDISVLVSIHGPIDLTSPRLNGITIGTLRIKGTRSVGFVVANVDSLQISNLDLQTIYTGGSIFSGLTNANIDLLTADDIGNTKRFISRQGTAVAVMTETKPVSLWYNHSGIKPTDGVVFGVVKLSRTTDSAFYTHDDFGTGVTNVHVKRISVDTSGKDGCKTRNGPTYVRFDTVVTNKTSLRGLDIESNHTTVGTVNVSNVGYDAVGDILGHPAPYTGGDGTNESAQTDPQGLVISTCSDVSVANITINHVRDSPYSGGEGHGIRLYSASAVTLTGSVTDTDGNGLRMAGSSNVTANVTVVDACRNHNNTVMAYSVSDGLGLSKNCQLTLAVSETGTPSVPYAVRLDSGCGITANVTCNPLQFTNSVPVRNNSSAPCT
ncbi:hypothetical protein [Beijerinckia indica]|uniref:Pectate lyase superfamily protein domain-containing protein n=1 Tax=Beijerinckia indica subsp. indica (strain ATCC 9039 / DSM 1715 / NCIMB 8712) TaxID=395963 RepID=B2IJI0_BEII9|nr:hypothetical protein [Beijerinckia indica]ACB96293.1 hypothetical protein Bind_2721 [Beijerinckia indica subsp. indica ATCC 9039]